MGSWSKTHTLEEYDHVPHMAPLSDEIRQRLRSDKARHTLNAQLRASSRKYHADLMRLVFENIYKVQEDVVDDGDTPEDWCRREYPSGWIVIEKNVHFAMEALDTAETRP